MGNEFKYGTGKLTVGTAIAMAAGKIKGVIGDEAAKKIKASQVHVQHIVENNKTVYGVNTGFGILSNTKISEEDTATLQYKILQSHSVGVGNPIPAEVAKLMLITKVHALAQGYSGVQLSTLERIIWHIENNVIPIVPEKGSVGASGDLAPLSHLFLPLIGLGECYYKGVRTETAAILKKENHQSVFIDFT
jgi:histidine ammonia-lyase